jgi:hypothetical protein
VAPELTIKSSLVSQEANIAGRIAPHKAEYNSLLLSALESIDASQLDARVEIFEGRQYSKLHCHFQISSWLDTEDLVNWNCRLYARIPCNSMHDMMHGMSDLQKGGAI